MRRFCLTLTGMLLVFCGWIGLIGRCPLHAAEFAADSPLGEVIREARQMHTNISDQVADYTCTLVKRERVNRQLLGYEYAELKLRHRKISDGRIVVPFSVYLKFHAPADVEGREVIFVEGRNGGKMIVRRGGKRFAYVTTTVDPLGELAMERNRYPITHIGIKNLIEELLVVGQEELENPGEELEVQQMDAVKVNGRTCRFVQFTHPEQRDLYRFHVAQIFVDTELNLPIRYAAYDWPGEGETKPRLLEEYTYVDLRVNVGLTDWDFDHRNESYDFLKNFEP